MTVRVGLLREIVEIVGFYQGAAFVITELLTVVFVVLKLTHHIKWSWWWVVSPIGIVGLSIVITAAVLKVARV